MCPTVGHLVLDFPPDRENKKPPGRKAGGFFYCLSLLCVYPHRYVGTTSLGSGLVSQSGIQQSGSPVHSTSQTGQYHLAGGFVVVADPVVGVGFGSAADWFVRVPVAVPVGKDDVLPRCVGSDGDVMGVATY